MTLLVIKIFLMVPRGKEGGVVLCFGRTNANAGDKDNSVRSTWAGLLPGQQSARHRSLGSRPGDGAAAWLTAPRLAGLLCQDGNCL